MIALTINNQTIPDADVNQYRGTVTDKMSSVDDFLSASISIEIDNSDPSLYDYDHSDGFFYEDWYNVIVIMRETDTGETLFAGRLKNIEKDDTEKTLTLSVENFVTDIADCDIEESFGTDESTTPAEIIYDILINYVGIPTSYVNANSFNTAQSIQTANSVYARLVYSEDDSAGAFGIIEDLCDLTNSYIYIINNTIYYKQWEEFSGEVGETITEADIDSYISEFKDDPLYNDYYYAYKSGSSVAFVSGGSSYETDSKYTYGTKKYYFPDEDDGDKSSLSDYRQIICNSTGAAYCANSICQRYKWIRKTCQISTTIDKYYINVGDQIDFTYKQFSAEPLLVTEKEYSEDDKTLTFTCEFRNYLRNVIIDTTAPDAVEIDSVRQISKDSAVVLWAESTSDDVLGYKLYFTKSSVWTNCYSDKGYSPLSITGALSQINGLYYRILSGLSENKTYKFLVKAFDERFNQSSASNIVKCTLFDTVIEANRYRTSGNLFTGIYTLINNENGGTVPDGFRKYGDANYDAINYEVSNIYESFVIQSRSTIQSILFGGTVTSGSAWIQYRTYSAGSFSDWSDAVDAAGNIQVDINAQAVQLRYIFELTTWADSGNIYIREIVEE